jgi:hydrogenase expression/formation protein HypC
MCLALPAQIIAIDATSQEATVALANIRKRISIALIEDPQIGDFVLVHVGYALHKISAEEAERTLQLMSEADLLGEGFTGDLGGEATLAKIARPA